MAENTSPGPRPDPRLFRAVWAGVGLLALVALGVAVWAWKAKDGDQISDPIFDPMRMDADWMAGGAEVDSGKSLGLLPDLRSAEVVIPDRPHDPEEAPTPEMKAGFTRLRAFTISTNGAGLRVKDAAEGEAVAEIGEKTGFRIVCIGASVSFGWGVSHEESYPALLAGMLGVEVINAGGPAGEPEGLVRWAEVNLPALDPDLVIFSLRPDYPREAPIQRFATTMKKLAQLALPGKLGVVLPPLSTFDFQLEDLAMLYPDESDVIARDIQEVTSALGSIPILGLTPVFREAQLAYRPDSADEVAVMLEKTLHHHRLLRLPDRSPVVETAAPRSVEPGADGWVNPESLVIAMPILEAFEAQDQMHEPYFFDGGHPDEAGYALFARSVASWVQEQGLIAP